MVLSAEYIRSLPGDRECLDALAWLAEHARKYPNMGFTPPLKPKKRAIEPTPFVALSCRIGRTKLREGRTRISRVDWFDGTSPMSSVGTVTSIASALDRGLLTRSNSGYLILTSGVRRAVLDTFLDSLGPELLKLGYTLSPCLSGGSVSFIVIRKGKYKWTIAYLESVSGASVSTMLALAGNVANEYATRESAAHTLYRAGAAYSLWLLCEFGVALSPTVGMIAMAAARVTLPSGFQKWRPDPLLVAMERQGYGYRGGMTYAQRYSGRTWRIDVTRQYTAALAGQLPLRSIFGRYRGDLDKRPGVYVCRVRLGSVTPYPLGIWLGSQSGFQCRTVGRGDYVCILHTSEFLGITAAGGYVDPSYGFTHTATFGFGAYVSRLQGIIDTFGRESPQAKLSKPLGNYVYGKFGQNPRRTELLYSESNPGKQWFPYWDEAGVAWPMIWERTVERHTASQHVDIAATITAAARSQTVETWAYLSAFGLTAVRCHTDSLTLDGDPRPYIDTLGSELGSWRLETDDDQSVIVGANAYFDQDGAHIAGVSQPTFEMIDRMLDGQVVPVSQTMKTPRRGFVRGETIGTKELRATAN